MHHASVVCRLLEQHALKLRTPDFPLIFQVEIMQALGDDFFFAVYELGTP